MSDSRTEDSKVCGRRYCAIDTNSSGPQACVMTRCDTFWLIVALVRGLLKYKTLRVYLAKDAFK